MAPISATKAAAFDIDKVRKNFPALSQGRICLDNAAGSLVLGDAVEATASYMAAVNPPPDFSDQESVELTEKWNAGEKERATFMNAALDEVTYGGSTTQLLRNLALSLLPNMNSDSEIIVSILCHEASASAWTFLAKRLGITIKWWSPGRTSSPTLDLEKLKSLLSPKTRLVTCGHISNVVGTIHPIRAVADIVHTVPGAMLCVDGVAFAPHRQIDVKALDVDFYCFSWYKVFGPHIGMIYARRSIQDSEMTSLGHYWLDPHALETKLSLSTDSAEMQQGLTSIVHYLNEVGWDEIMRHEEEITEVLLAYLRSRPELYVIYGEHSSNPELRVSLVTFSVKGWTSEDIANSVMNRSNIRIQWGYCYAKRPVQEVLGLGEDGVVRVSLVHYNTAEEVRTLVEVLDNVVSQTFNEAIGKSKITDSKVNLVEFVNGGIEGKYMDGYAKRICTETDVVEVAR